MCYWCFGPSIVSHQSMYNLANLDLTRPCQLGSTGFRVRSSESNEASLIIKNEKTRSDSAKLLHSAGFGVKSEFWASKHCSLGLS